MYEKLKTIFDDVKIEGPKEANDFIINNTFCLFSGINENGGFWISFNSTIKPNKKELKTFCKTLQKNNIKYELDFFLKN